MSDYRWLDFEDDAAPTPEHLVVGRDALESRSHAVLGEALTTQRLITFGARGLSLSDEPEQQAVDLQKWGHTLASAIAVMLPPDGQQDTPVQQRQRRQHRQQLLRAQTTWPDLAATSTSAFLICLDNVPPEIGLPEQLYTGRSEANLVGFSGFNALLQLFIKTVSPATAPAWMKSGRSLEDMLTTILAETFKNTHDHARHELSGSALPVSVRAIGARHYDVSMIQSMFEGTKTPSPALRFAHRFIPDPKQKRQGGHAAPPPRVGGVIELSVLDSGPGMAAKWLGRSEGVPVQDQLEATLACFAKGQTSTATTGRGFGLAKVLRALRELHGFISVRTNELHVFRQFALHGDRSHVELAGGQRVPEEKLFDWQFDLKRSATQRRAVRGTVVSFLLPMGVE